MRASGPPKRPGHRQQSDSYVRFTCSSTICEGVALHTMSHGCCVRGIADVSNMLFSGTRVDCSIVKQGKITMRSSIMVKRESASVETYVIGTEASKVLSAVPGITEVQIENQYVDRATLSFRWDGGRSNFDSRLNFDDLDRNLQSKGMHRMQ